MKKYLMSLVLASSYSFGFVETELLEKAKKEMSLRSDVAKKMIDHSKKCFKQGSEVAEKILNKCQPKSREISKHQQISFMIFVSSSMPSESLRSLFQISQKIGGRLIFRGLIKDSFQETKTYFEGLKIEADIDPTKFDEFQITQVPTFILIGKKTSDRLEGNISVISVLEKMESKGELTSEAGNLLTQIKGKTA